MREFIYELLQDSGSLSTEEIAINILMSAVLSVFIYLSYFITHTGTIYSRKFNASLVMMTVLTGTVMAVIGNNVALSLGMVGALSIVRYRTAVKDSRDTAYIFWAIIVGICCGVGDFIVAAIGSSIVFIILLALGKVKNDGRILLVVKAARNAENQIEGLVFEFYMRKARLAVKNTTPDTVELIYELSQRLADKATAKGRSITDEMYAIDGLSYVNLVAQNDEISG